MNLRQLAAGPTALVNPEIAITVKRNTGTTTAAPDGTQTPIYTNINTTGSVQGVTGRDLQHLNGLNVQGVLQKVCLNGNYEGLFRVAGQGGDLLVFNGHTWLVTQVLERWPDWCLLIVTLQDD